MVSRSKSGSANTASLEASVNKKLEDLSESLECLRTDFDALREDAGSAIDGIEEDIKAIVNDELASIKKALVKCQTRLGIDGYRMKNSFEEEG